MNCKRSMPGQEQQDAETEHLQSDKTLSSLNVVNKDV